MRRMRRVSLNQSTEYGLTTYSALHELAKAMVGEGSKMGKA